MLSTYWKKKWYAAEEFDVRNRRWVSYSLMCAVVVDIAVQQYLATHRQWWCVGAAQQSCASQLVGRLA
jgi:hypothetical protein